MKKAKYGMMRMKEEKNKERKNEKRNEDKNSAKNTIEKKNVKYFF